jgi:hypothetical protein
MSRDPLLLALASVVTAVAVVVGTATGRSDAGFEARKLAPQPASLAQAPGRPDAGFEARRLAPQPASLTVAEVRGAASLTVAEVRGAPAPSLEASAAEASTRPDAGFEARKLAPQPTSLMVVEILRAWDARRSRAWARGAPGLLRALYTSGSVAGRHDEGMLRAWTARGLVVRHLRTQLLSVRELARTRSSWTLLVTDRLAGGIAVGAGVRRPLPRDQATTRTVLLERRDRVWRVAAVTQGA